MVEDGIEDLPGRERRILLSQGLVALHVAGTAILILVVLSSVLWVSGQHNQLALQASQRLVDAGLTNFRARLRTLVNDYSIWDEAYQAAMTRDRAWLYSNIGNAAAEIGTLDLIYFVVPTTGERFGWLAGSPATGQSGLVPPWLLAPILKGLGDPLDNRSRTVTALFEGEPWIFAAALVQPVDGPPNGVPISRLPVQIHGMRISADRLAQIGQGRLLDDLQLSRYNLAGAASLPLVDYAGRKIEYITWQPPRPGADILRKVALPLGLALVLVSGVGAISSRYSVRSARGLERALLAAKDADRSKTNFLSNVSHELRTPMNGILGVAQLLQTTPLDDEQRELVELLFVSANAQMALISDLLDFSRMASGNRQVVVEPFEPAAVLRDVAEMMRVAADKKAITLDGHWGPLDALTVIGDKDAFRQIITNLVGNAIKFTDHGGVTLTAIAGPDSERIGLVVTVEDTGLGIPTDAIPHVFERFYQVDTSLSRNTEGTGLGLAISQSLAETVGGRIEVTSREGLGSTFTLTVGFQLADRPNEALDAA